MRWRVSYKLGGDFRIEGEVTADTAENARLAAEAYIRREAPQWFASPGPRLGAATVIAALHELCIISLHDAQAECGCGGWTFAHTGAMTAQGIEQQWRVHLHNVRLSNAGPL